MSESWWMHPSGVQSVLREEIKVRDTRIEELNNHCRDLEAKLAKAMEALAGVQEFTRSLEPYAEQGHTLVPALQKACETYNELKKETQNDTNQSNTD